MWHDVYVYGYAITEPKNRNIVIIEVCTNMGWPSHSTCPEYCAFNTQNYTTTRGMDHEIDTKASV